jgi:hypothetical protein
MAVGLQTEVNVTGAFSVTLPASDLPPLPREGNTLHTPPHPVFTGLQGRSSTQISPADLPPRRFPPRVHLTIDVPSE